MVAGGCEDWISPQVSPRCGCIGAAAGPHHPHRTSLTADRCGGRLGSVMSHDVRDVPHGAVHHVGVSDVDLLFATFEHQLQGADDAHMDR